MRRRRRRRRSSEPDRIDRHYARGRRRNFQLATGHALPFSSVSNPDLCIVVPTLNEAENIDPLLNSIFEACKHEFEVIIVDDGSTDGTRERVRAWSHDHRVRLLERTPNGGLAGAVLAGAREARSDVVLVMDADLSHPPERIPDVVRPVLDGEADMAIGSRYVSGGSTPDWPWRRRLISRAASWIAWPLVDVRDPMSGFFAVRRDRLLQASPEASGYKIGLEVIVAGGDSLKVKEIPIEFKDRRHGQSKLAAGQMLSYLDRLRSLAGASVSRQTSLRFAAVGLMGMVLDIACFFAMTRSGFGLAAAHIVSFAAATLFNFELNARWSFQHATGAHPDHHWTRYIRFLIVALLALLLRGAVLGTLVRVNGWPPVLAMRACPVAS